MPIDTIIEIIFLGNDPEVKKLANATAQKTGWLVIEETDFTAVLNTFDKGDTSNKRLIIVTADRELLSQSGERFALATTKIKRQVSIICLCNQWLDQTKYLWLRKVMNVFLILHKPVTNNIFEREIKRCYTEFDDNQQSANDPEPCLDQQLERVSPSQKAQQKQAKDIADPLTQTIQKLRGEISKEWSILEDAAERLKHDPSSENRERFKFLAHKIKGSAGSLGLIAASQNAAEIESLLALTANNDDLKYQLWWNAINTQLEKGRVNLQQCDRTEVTSLQDTDLDIESALQLSRTNAAIVGNESISKSAYRILKNHALSVERLVDAFNITEELEDIQPDFLVIPAHVDGILGSDIGRMVNADHRWRELEIIYVHNWNDYEYMDYLAESPGQHFVGQSSMDESLPALSTKLIAKAASRQTV